MKRYTITIFIILQLISAADVKSQFNNNHWVFGDSAYIDWSNPLSPVVGSGAFFNYRNGSSTIGDSSGCILLYEG
ncbi:MAG: hypothetical protein IPP46_13840 [Bacteroidetes bacterium]|nr:hypothetical protein [Bacteroidota bacterium]